MKLLWSALLLGVGLPLTGIAAAVGTPVTYDEGADGWVAYDMVNQKDARSLSVEDGVLKLRYGRQTVPSPPQEHVVRAVATTSSGQFAGDYIAAGVKALGFRIKREADVQVQVLLQNDAARRRWRYEVTGLPIGEWSTAVVSLDPDHLKAVHSGGVAAQLVEDLQNVSWVGVLVKRGDSMNEQITWLDDIRLLGPGPDFAAWMAAATGHAAWQSEMLPDGDLDGDGMVNIAEFIAGTDGADGRDVLTVSAGSSETGEGVPLKWKSVAGRTYCVKRASQADGEYVAVCGGIAGTPPENTYRDTTATGKGPWFYQVEVRKAE